MSTENPEAEAVDSEAPSIQTDDKGLKEESIQDTEDSLDVKESSDLIELPLGDALTLQEGLRITSATRTQLVVIAGPVKSGKTTLIAGLFHLFQRGPFADYLFAGSDTLIGLDKRCYLARIASERSVMDTARTRPSEERKLVHLRLRALDLKTPIKDVLISDLSGEVYREAKDSVDECRKLELVQDADHFILLVDGEKLINVESRQRVKNEANVFLRCCLDSDLLGTRSLVDVLFTKWDLVGTASNQPELIKFVDKVQSSIEQRIASRVGRLRFFRVAARPQPQKDPYKLGYGLEKPFRSWVEETSAIVFPTHYTFDETSMVPEFDCFFKRQLPHLFKDIQP